MGGTFSTMCTKSHLLIRNADEDVFFLRKRLLRGSFIFAMISYGASRIFCSNLSPPPEM